MTKPATRQRLTAGLSVATAAWAAIAIGLAASNARAQTSDPSPLRLEGKIPLGNVKGRIDHLAVDLARQRLFVAELGNDTVGVIDLKERKVLRTLTGLKEPQGVGYVASTDTLYVANARDGSVMLFEGDGYRPSGKIEFGNDADNIRVDRATNHVCVGYGAGALAVFDASSRAKLADIALPAHPEGFQLSTETRQIFVNLPSTRSIAVIDNVTGQTRTSWHVLDLAGHYPMALDDASRQVIVVFRDPARLIVFSMLNGTRVADLPTCGDSDDVSFDAKRQRVYVTCGEGFVDVFERSDGAYRRAAHVPTIAGARTSLFIPELDLLAVAARASGARPAELWLFRPAP